MANFKARVNSFLSTDTILPDFIAWAKIHSFPGLMKIPLYDVLVTLRSNFKLTDIMLRSSAIAFDLLIAFFPFTIFLLTTLPYFPIENSISILESYLHGLIPLNVEKALFSLINDTIQPRSGLLSIGFIAAVWFASNGMNTLINAFDQVEWVEKYKRPFMVQRGIGLFLTLVLASLLAMAVVSIVLSNVILSIIENYVTIDYITKGFILSARWIPTVILVYLFIATIYRIGPAIKKKIPFFSIGAAVATILFILVSAVISYFFNNFANYNRIYGSLGAVIAVMLWLQTNMLIILIGYELNLSVLGSKEKIKFINQLKS